MCEPYTESGNRPSIYGIDFYYKGTKIWDSKIPERRSDAEKGSIGCPWYDIENVDKKNKTKN